MDVTVGREFGKSLPAELRSHGQGQHNGWSRLMASGDAVQSGPGSRSRLSGLGITAQEIADLITSSSQATLPLIIANNPGTMMQTGANGQMVIYHQPTGTTANLPVGVSPVYPGYPGSTGPMATVQTPLGNANLFGGGLNMNYVVLAGAALLAVVLLSKK